MAATDLVVAMTGASGAPYGVRLLEVLLRAGRTVHLTLSPAAVEVLEQAGTPEATQLLQALASGAPEALLTREARASWQRLAAQVKDR